MKKTFKTLILELSAFLLLSLMLCTATSTTLTPPIDRIVVESYNSETQPYSEDPDDLKQYPSLDLTR